MSSEPIRRSVRIAQKQQPPINSDINTNGNKTKYKSTPKTIKTKKKTKYKSTPKTTKSKKRRKRTPIGRRYKKASAHTWSQKSSKSDYISRAEHRKSKRKQKIDQKDRDRKRDKKRDEKKQKDIDNKIEEINGDVLELRDIVTCYEMHQDEIEKEAAELTNYLLSENEKLIKAKETLQKLLNIEIEKCDKLWNQLHERAEEKYDEEYIYLEETDLDETNLEEQDEQTPTTKDINTLYEIYGPQSGANKKYKRYSVKIMSMAGDLNAFGVVAENIPKSIQIVLESYTDYDLSKIKIPSPRIIRHWIKHFLPLLNQMNTKKKISNIPKKELVSSGHDGSSLHSKQFNVTAISYKEAMDLVSSNARKLKNVCCDNKEDDDDDADDDIDYEHIKLKYKGTEIEISMESSSIIVFVVTSDEIELCGLLKQFVVNYEFDLESTYVEIPCPGIGVDIISKIIKFIKKYKTNPYKFKYPLNSTNIEELVDDKWYIDFLCISYKELVDLYKASIYLNIDVLLDLLEVKVLMDTIKEFNDGPCIDIGRIAENMSNSSENIEWTDESLIQLITNEDAVNVSDVGIEQNLKLRHRICHQFKHIFLEAADATDGTSDGTARMLKESISKFDVLRRIVSGISDQKTTENQGIIRAKGVVQSADFKQVYNEKEQMDDDENDIFLNTYCGTHVVVGISEAYCKSLEISYKQLQESGIIKYESNPQYAIRDVLKFFTSKEDGIKHSLDEELAGYLLQLAQDIGHEKWTDPTKGMRTSFAETREPYAYKLSARTWSLIEIILGFLSKVEFSAAPAIIRRFQNISQSPNISIYLHLLQIWAEYYVEPLKNYRVNAQCDQHQSLSSILISQYHQQQMLNDNRKLYVYLLGISNAINKVSFVYQWDDQKLWRYGSDLNYFHIKKELDNKYRMTFVAYPDLFQLYCKHYGCYYKIAMILIRLSTLLSTTHLSLNTNQFRIIYQYFISQICELWKETDQELPGSLFFWKQLLNSCASNKLHDVFIEIIKLFKIGLESAIKKATDRLLSRDVSWRFINFYIQILKLILASNDIIESLIGQLKRIHYSHNYYDYKKCGDLLAYKLNDTRYNILNDEELLNEAKHKIYNESKSYRELEKADKEKRNQHSINAFKLRMIKTEKERKQKQKKKQKNINTFNKWKDFNFMQSKSEFFNDFKEKQKKTRNKYDFKVSFMLNVLKYFKYCLQEEITLNSYNKEYELIKTEAMKYCEEYRVWDIDSDYKEKQEIIWKSLNEPISFFGANNNNNNKTHNMISNIALTGSRARCRILAAGYLRQYAKKFDLFIPSVVAPIVLVFCDVDILSIAANPANYRHDGDYQVIYEFGGNPIMREIVGDEEIDVSNLN